MSTVNLSQQLAFISQYTQKVVDFFVNSSQKLWFLCGLVVIVLWMSIAGLWNLHIGSLQPFDEAWYAAISRDMIEEFDFWHLHYNQQTFYDHPPLGFQLKALSMVLFGASTFSVRLPEVLAGVLSVVLVYIMGKRLCSSWAGFWSAAILLSSRWFLFRARSGNLDVLLLATQLLVMMAVVFVLFPVEVISKRKNKYNAAEKKETALAQTGWPMWLIFFHQHLWLWFLWFFLGLSLLAKTLISLQLLPVVGVTSLIYWWRQKYHFFSAQTWLLVIGCLGSLVFPLLPWLITYLHYDAKTFIDEQMRIGFRSGTEKSLDLAFVKTAFEYFNAATHKWYKIMLASSVLSLGLIFIKRTRPVALVLLSYMILVAAPYIVSEKTEVWHLVPLVGAMALLTGVTINLTLREGWHVLWQFIHFEKYRVWLGAGQFLSYVSVTVVILLIAVVSYVSYWEGFISVFSYPADYEKITWHISQSRQTLYTTTDAYFPGLVYYSNLDNARVIYLSDDNFVEVCQQHAKLSQPFQVVARFGDWMMTKTGDQFVTAREGGLVLIDMSPAECETFVATTLVH